MNAPPRVLIYARSPNTTSPTTARAPMESDPAADALDARAVEAAAGTELLADLDASVTVLEGEMEADLVTLPEPEPEVLDGDAEELSLSAASWMQ